MPFIPGEHYIHCWKCNKKMWSRSARVDRSGKLVCDEDYDPKQLYIDYPAPKLHQDPAPIPAAWVTAPGEQGNPPYNMNWEDVGWYWDEIDLYWEDL